MIDVKDLKFDDKGLIPAIIYDINTSEVLMLAYMNEESIKITLEKGYTCFYSRSRQKLWLKGETSGNLQKVVSIRSDCDNDTLLICVEPMGPACHTGAKSCFFNEVLEGDTERFSYEGLYELLEGRKKNRPEGSYTTYLFEKGTDKILKKIGEECTEVIIAGKAEDRAETVYEIADLAYHVMVLMVQQGITLDEIRAELASRHVIDKKVKQEKMTAKAE